MKEMSYVCTCVYIFVYHCVYMCVYDVCGVVYVSWRVSWRSEDNLAELVLSFPSGIGSRIELRLLMVPPTGLSYQSQETTYNFKLHIHCVTIGIKKKKNRITKQDKEGAGSIF